MTTASIQSDILQLVQRIQDENLLLDVYRMLKDITEEKEDEIELSDSHKEILDERTARYEANPNNVLSWEEVKANVRK